jgi:hypothetical protein
VLPARAGADLTSQTGAVTRGAGSAGAHRPGLRVPRTQSECCCPRVLEARPFVAALGRHVGTVGGTAGSRVAVPNNLPCTARGLVSCHGPRSVPPCRRRLPCRRRCLPARHAWSARPRRAGTGPLPGTPRLGHRPANGAGTVGAAHRRTNAGDAEHGATPAVRRGAHEGPVGAALAAGRTSATTAPAVQEIPDDGCSRGSRSPLLHPTRPPVTAGTRLLVVAAQGVYRCCAANSTRGSVGIEGAFLWCVGSSSS